MPRETHLSWDYENFNDEGLKPFKTVLGRSKVRVIDIDGTNKPTRSGGVQTKRAVLSLSDGQSLMLQVTVHGAIFQVRLNNQVIPVREKEDISSIAKELAKKIRANRGKFREKTEKQAQKIASGTPSAPRKTSQSTKKQLATVSADNTAIMGRLATIQAEFDAIDKEKAEAQARLNAEKTVLAETQEENTSLAKQIKQLEAA